MSYQAEGGDTLISKNPILLSRFDVLSTLGEGAVGAVYLVKDRLNDDQIVALKVLTNEIEFDDHTVDRFKQEIELLRELEHPNLIKAYDIIETEHSLAYTMEYVDGDDLSSIYRSQFFEYSVVDKIFTELLGALDQIHQRGVWHRDIKLENIMISKEGSAKLTDLGLVKNVFQKSLTKTGVLLGTAQYMPPEYVKSGHYDARSDLYAVGIVLFELLARKRRMADLPGNEVVEQLIKANFMIPSADLEGLPPKYVKIIQRSCNPDPKKRYQSASEMIEAFSDVEEPIVDSDSVEVKQSLILKNKQANSEFGSLHKRSAYKKYAFAFILLVLMGALIGVGVSKFLFKSGQSDFNLLHSLEDGEYQGKLDLFSSGSVSKEILLTKQGENIKISTGFSECPVGYFEASSGNIVCEKNAFEMAIFSLSSQNVYGELKNLNNYKKHNFSLQRR